ncbi:molybdopterin dinucleotide binding domain-containing protein, partial [Trueperella pyogenes]
ARTHSSYGNVDVLQAACRQEVWINPLDAEKRGIKNGDMVRVFLISAAKSGCRRK